MYATTKDFCRIFTDDIARLYGLALLLTADQQDAEQCFIAALDDCVQMNSVFKDFAKSWCRRAIIKNAVQKITPHYDHKNTKEGDTAIDIGDKLAAVMRLETFERHVFVISILEGYLDHECSILLDSTRADVVRARVSALRKLNATQSFESQTEEIMAAVDG